MDLQDRTLVMIPGEELIHLKTTLAQVLIEIKTLQSARLAGTRDEFITAKEFMSSVRICRTKFDQLVAHGKIKTIKKRRKIYVPSGEVKRYFSDPTIL